jgi:NAD(P)-dependent dehydrogenase (short-subunit alcohol dehydrogenase family)
VIATSPTLGIRRGNRAYNLRGLSMDVLRFEGRVAIVTGAGGSYNLGRSHAHLLAARGAKVVVNDLGVGPGNQLEEPADAEAVAEEIRAAGGEAIANTNTVAEEGSAKEIIDLAIDEWGRLDILVNNAGYGSLAFFNEINTRDIERFVGVNLMGPIWMCRAAWPHMCRAGYGRIVNTTSGGMMGMPGMSLLAASKFGAYGLTRGLAVEGAEYGIKVNALSPGAATNSVEHSFTFTSPEILENYVASFPPKHVSAVIAYLVHESCTATGTMFAAGGGDVSARIVAATPTFSVDDITPEDVAANIDVILNTEELSVVTDPLNVEEPGGASPVLQYMVPKDYRPSTL